MRDSPGFPAERSTLIGGDIGCRIGGEGSLRARKDPGRKFLPGSLERVTRQRGWLLTFRD